MTNRPVHASLTRREFVQGTLLAGAAGLAGTGGLAASARGEPLAETSAVATDWPMYRHDTALSATASFQGGFSEAPRVAWSLDLGGPNVSAEYVIVRDVTGEGREDFLTISSDCVTCRDARGNVRWKLENYLNVSVVQILDFADDGSRGILLTTYRAGKIDTYMVNGRTGKSTHLWLDQNNFGGHTRVGKLLASVPGLQIASTASGQTPPAEQGGDVRLVSFEHGLDNPNFRIRQHVTGVFYSPLILIVDLDGDGQEEMAVLGHEQLWAFDTLAGQQKLHASYSNSIRTYMATVAAIPLQPADTCPALVMINPSLPGLKAVSQDGRTFARELWKVVIGGEEDQYQKRVTITAAGSSLVYDPDGSGRYLMMATIHNEHGDGQDYLVVFDTRNGERLAELPNAQILCADDLDGDGNRELLLQRGSELHISRWEEGTLRTLWQQADVQPLVRPLPTEGDLRLTSGASAIAKGNSAVWRVSEGSQDFLFRFADGVHACRLDHHGIEQGALISEHEALGNLPAANSSAEHIVWDGATVRTIVDGQGVYRYSVPAPTTYLAPPPIVADLDGQRRILVKNAAGDLLLCTAQGETERVFVQKPYDVPELVSDPMGQQPLVCDVDGDGEYEVLVTTIDSDGRPACVILDGSGREKRRLEALPGMTRLNRGPTGSLGPGQGRWILLRMSGEGENNQRQYIVAAYDGRTGEQFWVRDHYGMYDQNPVVFMAHFPAVVLDYNQDGVDDWLVCSENFHGIIDVRHNKDLVGPVNLSNALAGHWTAYTFPTLGKLHADGPPVVFHHGAYALVLVTDLEGQPLFHYGLTRDTAGRWGQFVDLDGDSHREVIHAQPDGVLRCFAPGAAARCPTCAPESTLATSSPSPERWQLDLGRPVSRVIAADLDGDGRMELLFGCDDGQLHALAERDGQPRILWSVPLGRRVGEPILADVDGDGLPEILVTAEDGRLYCLRAR